ncbi:MAG: GrpB family protein [Anaerolineae bacterium]|nr:GrpB family protein [Anaerolineae bacterium]
MVDYDPFETFELADYNAEWPARFEREADAIAEAMGDDILEMEHIGSTSVPGLSAKPIIDLMMVVEVFAPLEDYQKRLKPLGYTYQSHENDSDRLFFWKGAPRTYHLHVVEFATWEYHRHLMFRDYLRSHPDTAALYEQIKRELAEAFKAKRPSYTAGKTAFIKNIMARAVEEVADPELRRLSAEAEKRRLDQRKP